MSSPDVALQRVRDVVAAASSGRSATLSIVGQRGSGKTWLLDQAAELAAAAGMTVLRAAGRDEERDVPFGALAMLLAPYRRRLDAPEVAAVRSVVALEPGHVDPFEVKVATFRLLCAEAAERPLCVLLDDADRLDAASAGTIAFINDRVDADAIACIFASSDGRSLSSDAVRLDVWSPASIAAMLAGRGLTPAVAEVCAEVANGLPGIAVAVADGLSDAQRSGASPITAVPRLGGELAASLQQRLRAHGERVCRALVVAAAERDGDVGAVRAALGVLGEPLDGLDEAEAAGIVDIVDGVVSFSDPWLRPVSYHLVAPASRRSAHRAIAAALAAPEQAMRRAWHLAAGADGPSEPVAEALSMVAADAARRGAPSSAARTAERAAALSAEPERRRARLLDALAWWMEVGDAAAIGRVAAVIEPADAESAIAVAEAAEHLDGGRVRPQWDGRAIDGDATSGWWAQRRRRRIGIDEATAAGDHRTVIATVAPSSSSPSELVALATALRHAGRVRDAREVSMSASAMLAGSTVFAATAARLLEADLDVLQGRADDARAALTAPTIGAAQRSAERLRARVELQSSTSTAASSVPAAFAVVDRGPLAAVRELIAAGVAAGDAERLRNAIVLADEHALPIEAGEARLWMAGMLDGDGRRDAAELARATLQRCGVRAWEPRVDALLAVREEAGTRRTDPAIAGLTQGELRVAEAVASGQTNREVAASLFVSVKTVDFHLQQIYRKLTIRSRTELAIRMNSAGDTR